MAIENANLVGLWIKYCRETENPAVEVTAVEKTEKTVAMIKWNGGKKPEILLN